MTLLRLAFGAFAALLLFINDVLAADPKVCETEACKKFTESIRYNIDPTRAPCDDFFDYACSGYIAKNPIPDDKSQVGTFQSMYDKVDEEIHNILNEAVKAKEDDPQVFQSKVMDFTVDLYRSCLNLDEIRSVGNKPVSELIYEILSFEWPLIQESSCKMGIFHKRPKFELLREVLFRANSYGQMPLFNIAVLIDANLTMTRVFDFDAPKVMFGHRVYKEPNLYPQLWKHYKEYAKNIFKAGAGRHYAMSNESTVDARIDEMFELEKKLALAIAEPEELRSPHTWYNNLKIGAFDKIGKDFRWQDYTMKFLDKIKVEHSIDSDTKVIVEDIQYFEALPDIVNKTSNCALYNYLGFRIANHYAKYTEGEMREAMRNFAKQRGAKAEPPVWRSCMSQVLHEFPFAVSRLYVEKYVDQSAKADVMTLVQNIKDEFRNSLNKAVWMSLEEFRKSEEKLKVMHRKIGYPQWIFNNTKLDLKYGIDQINKLHYLPGVYLHNILKNDKFSTRKMFRDYKTLLDYDYEWPIPPSSVSAVYMAVQNSITIPAAIMRLPFFEASLPAYINYATIGSIIGHEITHGFDDEGSYHDGSGNINAWWSQKTRQKFAELSECFVRQYAKIIDRQTGKNLNGVNTQGENTADNGGLRQAYYAYKNYEFLVDELPKLPALDEYSNEQLFFLAYASIWCGHVRTPYLKTMIDYDAHSPARYRVNVVLKNFPKFAEAFQCLEGTGMNPSSDEMERCVLW